MPGGQRGGDSFRIGNALAVGGVETKESQDAQIVLGNAPSRIADEAHAPRLDVGQAADVVVKGSVARERQRVHGEIAALGVAFPIAAESYFGMTTEGLHILA